jgi:hypothetical protein
MEIRYILLGLCMAALLFSGCVSLEYAQKVDRNGNSVITETIDMSVLLSAGSQYEGASEQLAGVCDNITQEEPGANCTYSEGVLTISKAVLLSEKQYTFTKSSEFPNTVYTLEIHKLPEVVKSDVLSSGDSAQTDTDFKSSAAKMSASTLKTAGATLTYTVEMPGEIESAENGNVVSDKSGRKVAQYDVIGLMSDGKYIIVRSKELDMPLIAMIGGALVLLVGGLVVAFVLLKAMKKPAQPPPASPPPAPPSA